MKFQTFEAARFGKFEHPTITAMGHERATVSLSHPETLWFNTGTLCNITCENCYIHSSPTNDMLTYISETEVRDFLDQIKTRGWPVSEIGFTGGEPFMNPEMIALGRVALAAGYRVLILTNAMRPLMRARVKAGLIGLHEDYGDRLTLRVSLDNYSARLHDKERGPGSFEISIQGMRWLRENGFKITVAGRTVWGESEAQARAGYAELYHHNQFDIDAEDPAQTVLFPEMDETADVPEITTACWDYLNKSPDQVMCATSRMVVKRRGAAAPVVVACTLLPYAPEFELGATLAEAERDVSLNHPHCAKFCVLGGASCSG
jgi:uncharacterized Fe-S cluster-containing radical SAM superfamily protein